MSDDVNHDNTERDELDAGIEALLGELDVDDLEPIRPPDDLWAGIERRVAVADETSSPSTAVRSIGDRRRRRTTWVLAAAAGLIVVLGVVAVVRRGTSEDVVSVASLAFDPTTFDPRGADATGEAHLLDSHGSYSIRLTDTKLPKVQGDDLELWLIEPGADGKSVDIAYGSTNNGTAVQQYASIGGNNAQKFSILASGSNWKLAMTIAQNKCVGMVGNGTGNGAAAEIQDCNGSNNQAWTASVVSGTTDTFTFKNVAANRCLDVSGASGADGARMQLWDCNNQNNQRFQVATN